MTQILNAFIYLKQQLQPKEHRHMLMESFFWLEFVLTIFYCNV